MLDRVMIGSIAGISGAGILALFSFVFNFLGITQIELLFLNSSIFLLEPTAHSIAGNLYGLIIHLLVGAMVGVVYIYLLPYTGTDYLIYKGIFLGAITWLIIGGVMANILNLPVKNTIIDQTIYTLLNIVFGLVTVFSVQYLKAKV
ncbi:hypothetical protein [Candidatus Formimonas warabiya]|uniref:DUF1440 domain-containing protein n=1 Tax=Formimonas warabiya TaxID=1761012 RepID=A0A3G1KMS3_FORW1|nr:hypothetical protein [Candidatus Formimonas warabiya]ATW23781.1 hypothetical protein DCMF_02320 [Candidatus Formimonas warabiya]